jgi:aldehyde dehydrogenase (NAD+)
MTTPPAEILNSIAGKACPARSDGWFEKVSPVDGKPLCRVARSLHEDVRFAVKAARKAQPAWADVPPVKRGEILCEMAMGLRKRREEVARLVCLETGKSFKDALGETSGAAALGIFMAGEGQRLYGRTTTSGIANRQVMTVREPVGVAGLIVAANTPIANVAWKVFPALICGNTAVLKAAEDAPFSAWIFGEVAREAGLPDGALNIIHGLGAEAGAPLVADREVDLVSFTGSTAVGREIAQAAGRRLARVSLELGGKNPFVVCDDADLGGAVRWALLSAFSNAGQRCAAASRLIVFDAVYAAFAERLVEATRRLKVGSGDDDDLGAVINEKQLRNMIAAVERAQAKGAVILTGGSRLTDPAHREGFYMAPTLIEGAGRHDEISATELFGPIACLYRARDFREALDLANDSPYGLTACIHTGSIHRALEFTRRVQAGIAVVNAGTYGSEPHLPFGGLKQSGNGSREPGTEALDVYSSLKNVYLNVDPEQV